MHSQKLQSDLQAFESKEDGLNSHAVMMDTSTALSWDLMDLGTPEPAKPARRDVPGTPANARDPAWQASVQHTGNSGAYEGGRLPSSHKAKVGLASDAG